MRGGRTALVLVSTAAVIAGTGLSAHRRDEYLQSARIAVDPGRVELQLDLTPGIDLADPILADIDLDGDEFLSSEEQVAYVANVLSGVELTVDGTPLRVKPLGFSFPDLDAVRRGEGTIQIRSAVDLPSTSNGAHHLVFRNTHRPDVSVYLANALVPESGRIAITAQTHSGDQRDLTIDYTIKSRVMMWLSSGIAGAVLVIVIIAVLRSSFFVPRRPSSFVPRP